ncbi:MAG: hypothetical protein ACE366_14540 [Bradymonadia bacterium]
MHVRACLPGAKGALLPGVEAGYDLVRPRRARPMQLDQGVCVRYQLDLEALTAASEPSGRNAALAPDRLLWPGLWLWRPEEEARPPEGSTVTFDLPPGTSISTAWPAAGDDTFRLQSSALSFRSRMALGPLKRRMKLDVAGGTIDAVFLGGAPTGPLDAWRDWITRAARGTAALYGDLPAPHVQLLVVLDEGSTVHFGMTQRGGGPGIVMFVGRHVRPSTLKRDWTLTHELFHLGMPQIAQNDLWLSEGVTTYSTFVAMARAGTLDAESAWAELADGFRRGQRQARGLSLQHEGERLRRTGRYARVYWGGALWALRADLVLRAKGSSLPHQLIKWRQHQRQDDRVWSARALLDTSAHSAALQRLVLEHVDASTQPGSAGLLETLGVDVNDAGEVTLTPASGAKMRRDIIPE